MVRSKNRPNVLLLFSDQHKAEVVGYEGHPDVITPNLDKLAAGGVSFSRAYCQDAICAPSRMSMFTGLYPRTLGVLTNGDRTAVSDDAVSMASLFSQNGYTTAAFGKRHLAATPLSGPDQGWDIHKSHLANESPDDNYVTWVESQGYGKEFMQDWSAEFGKGPKGGAYADTENPLAILATRISNLPEEMTMEAYTAQETIAFLKEHGASGKPFFCWSSFYRPHQPYTPLRKYMELYDVSKWGKGTHQGDGIRKPQNLDEPFGNLPPVLQTQHTGGNPVWRLDLAREDDQIYRDYMGSYYALVTEIDHHVGRIIHTLEEEGLLQNTIIVYTADHGDFVGSHGMVEKCAHGHNVYEDTLRVPLIVYWQGKVISGMVADDIAELVDILPTLLDCAEIAPTELKHPLAGKSLRPLLTQEEPLARNYSVSENWLQSTVITERYKLAISHHLETGLGDMLFDREKDPLELNNRCGCESYGDVEATLRDYYREWESKVPDTGRVEMLNRKRK